MPKNLGLYNDDLSTPRKKDVDACYGPNNAPPYPVTSVSGKTGAVTLTKANVGLNNVDNVKQYSANNPPPYPVTSVNGKIGGVNLTASDVGAIPASEKGAVSGVATLGTDGKVPESQLPEISASKTFTATIGTTWTENADTGVKSQSIAIAGVLAKHTAKVDHAYTGDGTSDGYAAFVEAENQYLTYITNGYAETYDGGITFHIFGDAPTVSIPIVVEVA